MGLFDEIVNFGGGIADEFGLSGSDDSVKTSEELGSDFAAGLKDMFSNGIDSLKDEFYGVPTGDPHQVVETKGSTAPVSVGGQAANVQAKNIRGGGVTELLQGENTLVIFGAAILFILLVKK